MIHELKTDPLAFDEIAAGRKTFELRYSDRPFRMNDVLHLRRTDYSHADMASRHIGAPLRYSDQEIVARVVGILRGPCYGLMDGWCIMSIAVLEQGAQVDSVQYNYND